jgi:hypothetical protein
MDMKKIENMFFVALLAYGYVFPVHAEDAISCEPDVLKHRYERMENADWQIRVEERNGDAHPDAEWLRSARDANAKRRMEIGLANQLELDRIVASCGYPRGPKTIGNGPHAAFYIIHHASLDYQLKYLPLIKESMERGETDAYLFALLEDRMLVRQGKPQKYGFQRWPVVNGVEQKLVQDPEHVNERRARFGQQPIPGFP